MNAFWYERTISMDINAKNYWESIKKMLDTTEAVMVNIPPPAFMRQSHKVKKSYRRNMWHISKK